MKNYSVVGEAENGEELLEKMNTANTDIILMDINIPKMNGIESTKLIKSKYSDQVKIIALSQIDDFV